MKYLGQINDNKDLVNKEYVDDNNLIIKNATGNNIHIADSADKPFHDFRVWSKNLIDVTELVGSGCDYSIPNPLKKAGTYIASVQNIANVGSCIFFYNNGVRVGAAYGGYTFGNPTKTCIMTIPEEQANCDTMKICGNGALPDYVTAKLQIEIGDTITDYQPYVDTSSVDVTVCGKNLVDLSKFIVGSANCKSTSIINDTISIVASTTSSMVFIGLNGHQGVVTSIEDDSKVICNLGTGKYNLQYKINGVQATNTNGGYWTGYYSKDGVYLASQSSDAYNNLTFNVPENCYWVCFNILVRNCIENETYIISDLQFEKSETATAYEPYKSQTVTVTPDGEEWKELRTNYNITNITNNLNAEMSIDYVSENFNDISDVGITNEYYDLNNIPYNTKTASGKLIHIEDSAHAPIQNIIIERNLVTGKSTDFPPKSAIYQGMLAGAYLDIIEGETYYVSFVQPANCSVYKQSRANLLNVGYTGYSAPTVDTVIKFSMKALSTARADLTQLISHGTTTDAEYSVTNLMITQNPNYPDYVNNVNNIDVTICGKNIFNGTLKTGAWYFNGDYKPDFKAWASCEQWMHFQAGDYVLSLDTSDDTLLSMMERISFTSDGNTFETAYFDNNVVRFKIVRDCDVHWGIGSDVSTNNLIPYISTLQEILQIEKGNGVTEFEPYKSQTVTITPSGEEWKSLHTYYDISNITNNINTNMDVTYVTNNAFSIYPDDQLSLTSENMVQNKVITQKLNDINADITNIEIGGRNFLLDSDNTNIESAIFNGTYQKGAWTIEHNVSIVRQSDGYLLLSKNVANTTRLGILQRVMIDTNTDYIFSIYYKPSHLTIGIQLSNNDTVVWASQIVDVVKTDSGRYIYKFNSGLNTRAWIYIYQYSSTDNFTFMQPKLEKGNVPSDWTPAPEDKADYDHTHKVTDITDFPTTLKNPTALTVQGNGTTSFTYDGSAAKTLNIKAGTNVSVSSDTNGNITINSTDTNTHYTANLIIGASNSAVGNAASTNGNTFLNLVENNAIRNSHNIVGTGATTVTSDADGKITINSINTVYTHPTATAYNSGLYKIAVNTTGHVISATAVTKSDITGLGIPGTDTNTTYSAGTGLSLSGTTFNHKNSITAGTISGTATSTIGFSGKVTIPSITYDAQGHITGVTTTTVTLPANPNTDTKVTQNNDTSNADYRVILSVNANDTNETNTVKKSNKITANPSTGELKATKMTINSHCTLEYDTTNECLNFNFS